MAGPTQAFLGRQPILDRGGELMGYELLYRASAAENVARFDNEDEASLEVLGTLLGDLGASQVLAGKQAFINVGPGSLRDTAALGLMNPRRTVLELSREISATPEVLERVTMLRGIGFGIAVSAVPPLAALEPWLSVVSHLKVDLQRVPESQLEAFVGGLRAFPPVLIAEKVETAQQMRQCVELGFEAFQGFHIARPEVMGSVKLGVNHAVLRRMIDLIGIGADTAELEATMRQDVALCFRLLRYVAASNFGLLMHVDSLAHAIELVGPKRLSRWLQLLLTTVESPSAAAAMLTRAAVFRGRMLEMLGAEYFAGADCDNLFLVGALSLMPAMLIQPMSRAITNVALPESVCDALLTRQGPYGAFLDLVEADEAGNPQQVDAMCDNLTISAGILRRAQVSARAAAREAAFA